ncbi:helix-turn-helix domain-containing protein [Anaerocolumna sp. MB42-C2]|uniref:helix-turn-helix domain-containing protein n=1 Tax=Anaerocolumna sp. MB42-C2 TaxID=3070997 RepID=UPI0027E1EDF1|nr:helix-turn-helix transcriptional regulator [Anaerocolumna sp. MB42-C2]WMJ89518.1 helix-turn-helix transcriptional regulator [Anaerocolumna sp. MB42-C2]
MDIGKKIRNLRLEKNIPQNDLAQILGVSKSTMSNYERNYSTPDPDILVKLAEYFNVSVDYLFDYENSRQRFEGTKETTNYTHSKSTVLTKDEWNVLNYYNRLTDEYKDYIKGRMIQLHLDQLKEKNEESSD